MTQEEYNSKIETNKDRILLNIDEDTDDSWLINLGRGEMIVLDSCQTDSSDLWTDGIVDILQTQSIYYGPTQKGNMEERSNGRLGTCIVITREQYKDFTNPKFFRQSLYDNVDFWKSDLVLNTYDCLHMPGAYELLENLFPNEYQNDNTLHYNSYYYPMNQESFEIMYNSKLTTLNTATANLFK